jgi:hypothetical protein
MWIIARPTKKREFGGYLHASIYSLSAVGGTATLMLLINALSAICSIIVFSPDNKSSTVVFRMYDLLHDEWKMPKP